MPELNDLPGIFKEKGSVMEAVVQGIAQQNGKPSDYVEKAINALTSAFNSSDGNNALQEKRRLLTLGQKPLDVIKGFAALTKEQRGACLHHHSIIDILEEDGIEAEKRPEGYEAYCAFEFGE